MAGMKDGISVVLPIEPNRLGWAMRQRPDGSAAVLFFEDPAEGDAAVALLSARQKDDENPA